MNTVLSIIYLLGVPLLVMQLAKRWNWIEKVSPMTVLYLIGLAVARNGRRAAAAVAAIVIVVIVITTS